MLGHMLILSRTFWGITGPFSKPATLFCVLTSSGHGFRFLHTSLSSVLLISPFLVGVKQDHSGFDLHFPNG